MKSFIKEYTNPNEERFNYGLINREYDDDLIEYIVNSCRSLEVLKEIKFLGYDFISDEKEIDMNDYISTRKRSKKKDETKYMYMQDSRYMEIQLRFKLTCKGEVAFITKKLLVPIPDENGYYTIKGKKYFLLYQLVDSSTYTTRNNVTLKSLMPVPIKRVMDRTMKEFVDTDGSSHAAPTYVVYLFRKEVKVLQLYFARIGITKTLEYFNVNNVMRFVESERDKERYMYFPVSNKILLEVHRDAFLKFQYVQSVVAMILDVVTNRLSFDLLDDRHYWTERLGSLTSSSKYNHYEKGMNTLTSFSRMLDETTKKILKMDIDNRKNIYAAVRWMVQNYSELRKKDNMDLANKRLRCNEYIASLLTKAFSERINRAISLGNKLSIDRVKDIFKFQGNLLLDQLYRSGLLRYDDRINDMDFFSKVKYTMKGPNALGGKNDNNISVKHRGIHPSFLGRIDINVCGSSDPGSSGIITPFCKTDGLYFDGAREPEDGVFDLIKESSRIYAEEHPDKMLIDVFSSATNVQEMFDIKNKIQGNISKSKFVRTELNPNKMRIHIHLEDDDRI